MSFNKGDQVVCINVNKNYHHKTVLNQVYTVHSSDADSNHIVLLYDDPNFPLMDFDYGDFKLYVPYKTWNELMFDDTTGEVIAELAESDVENHAILNVYNKKIILDITREDDERRKYVEETYKILTDWLDQVEKAKVRIV